MLASSRTSLLTPLASSSRSASHFKLETAQMPPPLRSAGASIRPSWLLVPAAASVSAGATRRTLLPVCEAVQFREQMEAAGGGNSNHLKIQHVFASKAYSAAPRTRSGEVKNRSRLQVRWAPARFASACSAALRQSASRQMPWQASSSAGAQVPTPLVSWWQSSCMEQQPRLCGRPEPAAFGVTLRQVWRLPTAAA